MSPFPNPKGIKRAALLFAGGPAPAANAVISTAAFAFQREKIEVLGIRYGYSQLVKYGPDNPLQPGRDYIVIDQKVLKRTRNSRGILLGTARENPGEHIDHPSHLRDPERTRKMRTVYDALCSLEVDALISIGGDDTLKTANKFMLYQETLSSDSRRIPVVHVPKTIDNDYSGIDFTFGYFTAVEFLAGEVRNLLADAESTRCYYIVETMGRSAGWLAYGTAIAGEASLVISVEDVTGRYATTEKVPNPKPGEPDTRVIMNVDQVIDWIVHLITGREEEGKESGVVILAEGLAEYLPQEIIAGVPRDPHGHIAVSQVNLHRRFAEMISQRYKEQTGRPKRVTGVQIGYEARCALPTAFDVMLGSQLGVGACRALVEKGLNGVMVSVKGQLNLEYVKFDELVDPETLKTKVRYVDPHSDFHMLARFLEKQVNH